MSERRQNPRHLACFPIHIVDPRATDSEPATALIRDLSAEGAQVLTLHAFDLGATLTLVLYLEDPEQGYEARGTVVRSEPRDDGGIWPHLVGVKFDARLDGIQDQVQALAERQKKAGL